MVDADDYYDRVFKQRLNLWRINDTVKRYMLNPALGKMLCRLAGVGGMRVWHDQALIKPPFGNPTGWHLDNPYWSFSSPHSISIWIALDASTYQNGCMYYVPGSQLIADYRNVPISDDIGALFQGLSGIPPARHGRGPGQRRPVVVRSTTDLTAHGAGANDGPRPPPGHDLRLHAGRIDIQRADQHPAGELCQNPQGRRRPEPRRGLNPSGRCSWIRVWSFR